MFRTLAECCADCIIGGLNSKRSKVAWKQVYRALEHNHVKTQCANAEIIKKFHASIQTFANIFISMQSKRHTADYDPEPQFYKSEVLLDIETVRATIAAFKSAPMPSRKAFAAWLLVKNRKL